MSRSRHITPDTYGRALGAMVTRHNTSPEHLQTRIAELEALVERQRLHIRELESALADSPAPSVFEGRPANQRIGGQEVIALKDWAKSNGLTYWQAYRRVANNKVNAIQKGRNWFVIINEEAS